MKEQKFLINYLENPEVNPLEDSAGVPDGADAETYIKDLVKKFNDEEDNRKKQNPAYPIQYRVYCGLVGDKGKQVHTTGFCEWGEKLNVVTIDFQGSMFDILQCQKCQLKIQRFRLDEPQRICTDLVCVECNKQFKTKSGLRRHIKAENHLTPAWCYMTR